MLLANLHQFFVLPDPKKLVFGFTTQTVRKVKGKSYGRSFFKSSSTFSILWLQLFKIPNGKLSRQGFIIQSDYILNVYVYTSINSIEAGGWTAGITAHPALLHSVIF